MYIYIERERERKREREKEREREWVREREREREREWDRPLLSIYVTLILFLFFLSHYNFLYFSFPQFFCPFLHLTFSIFKQRNIFEAKKIIHAVYVESKETDLKRNNSYWLEIRRSILIRIYIYIYIYIYISNPWWWPMKGPKAIRTILGNLSSNSKLKLRHLSENLKGS